MIAWPRVIVHADMDAFYAAVEQLDDPGLRGKPVLVGPRSWRGVVLTASYEARPYGVGSAMPVAEARRRCPDAVMVPPRFERYEAVSKQVMDILGDFSPAVEPLSLDEAFVDMSGTEHIFGAPDGIGRKIRAAVYDATGLRISVGISGTKYVAKVASDHGKPDGLTIVPPAEARAWLAPLPVSRLWGVGRKTAPKLEKLGYRTIGDVAGADERELQAHFGSAGTHYHKLANATDPRRVSRGRGAKSIGSERTLERDVSRREEIEPHLRRAAERIARRLRAKSYVAGGVRVRLKTSGFDLISRQRKLSQPNDTEDILFSVACELLGEFEHPGPFRLIGMAAFDLDWRQEARQSDLFAADEPRRLETTIDGLIERFGKGTVVRAKDLERKDTVHDDGVNLDFLDYRDGERVSKPERDDR